ncbi:LysR family hca operon transcriptional activator [Azomonas agilis]|uniref:LysR family hca operon transcriptional activator n=1 Tax=Azomonas agilis TaxID=116849 RepID=A0A562IYP6_9GAMM|nr:LysR substrate-binding domain-containing protein [Azomonas agilis]TWH76016.1 LysR family hca operon transcriptional activator [Azomonas agilis]
MELRHLRYFIAVAETLNFTRAAERLHTAQPSLSQQIKDLEDELGTSLLTRSKRRVELTPAGTVFLNEARLVLAQAERAILLARQAAQLNASQFSIGFVPSAEIKIFPHVLPTMRAQYPNLELNFHSLTTAEQIKALVKKTIDVAFLRPPIEHPDLSSEAIMTEPLVLVMPADHPLSQCQRILPEHLMDTDFIQINAQQAGQSLYNSIQDWLQRHHLDVRVTQEVHNVLTLLTLISMGGGVSLLPDYAEQMLFRNIATRHLEDEAPPSTTLLMAWRTADTSMSNQFFRGLVRELVGL